MAEDATFCFTGNFYAVRFVQTRCGEVRYGRQCVDFQYAMLAFTKPGGLIRIRPEDVVGEGISGILFHPDLFETDSLLCKKTDYAFFHYRENESLHLFLKEKRIVQDCLKHIHEELRHGTDRHTLRLLSAGMGLLLNYCVRFYERQFACRTDTNREYLTILNETLAHYFSLSGQKSVEDGVGRIKSSLSFFSSAYLNDLVRLETGKTLSEYVRVKMMEYIKKYVRREGRSLKQVAGEFGFCQPYVLMLLYRQIFGHLVEELALSPEHQLN